MTNSNTLEKVKQVWNTWDIRVFILTSLLIQAVLTFLAPRRKHSHSGIISFFMWLLYLSADAIALYTIGQIASNPGDSADKIDLLAFWAPFLLLHLGGPDSITALALEDNALWHRHALQLGTQVVVTLYVFGQSVHRRHNNLWIPTVLMFVDGLIKYLERTQALYYASMDNFRDSLRTKAEAGPNYARFMEAYSSAVSANLPTSIQDRPPEVYTKSQGKSRPNDLYSSNNDGLIQEENRKSQEGRDPTDLNGARTDGTLNKGTNATVENDADVEMEEFVMIKDAYKFYDKFKGLLADSFMSLKDREESRSFFLHKTALAAFRIIQIELNFIYDVFYSKVFLLHTKQVYARIVSFLCVVTSLCYFILSNRTNYHKTDVGITFALLGGAIAMDLSSSLMLVLSDWCIIITQERGIPQFLRSLLMQLRRWLISKSSCHCCRWSQCISNYNLLERSFKDSPLIFKLFFIQRIRDAAVGFLYVHTKQVNEKHDVKFIVEELQKKADLASDIHDGKKVSSARGNFALENEYFLVSEYLSVWTVEIDYDESLLIWHLATDICYWTSVDNESTKNKDGLDYCQFSKRLSDYMSYLLLRQQSLVSPVVGMSDVRFEHTCEEARKFMNPSLNISWSSELCSIAKKLIYKKIFCQESMEEGENRWSAEEIEFYKKFCQEVLKVEAHIQPIVAKGDKSKSVLFDACRLASQLKEFGDKQWEITAKVWVELLCYAATRCSPRSHVAQLSKGGELITLVWWFMVHLGLGERFLQNQGFGWTKLIISK